MKITALSDIHGSLIDIKEQSDVVVIAGDIVPLEIQNKYVESIVWFTRDFTDWCMKLPCKKVIFVAGNHDFFIYNMMNNIKNNINNYDFYDKSSYDVESVFYNVFMHKMDVPDKIVYLQDSSYLYDGVLFYGSPWIPVLKNWAFYKDSYDLGVSFDNIPDKVDVLITHSPGKFVCDTGVSLQKSSKPEYGSDEITDAVKKKDIKYWICGHIHSGNHNISSPDFNPNMKVANVSIKDEYYNIAYEPLSFEIL